MQHRPCMTSIEEPERPGQFSSPVQDMHGTWEHEAHGHEHAASSPLNSPLAPRSAKSTPNGKLTTATKVREKYAQAGWRPSRRLLDASLFNPGDGQGAAPITKSTQRLYASTPTTMPIHLHWCPQRLRKYALAAASGPTTPATVHHCTNHEACHIIMQAKLAHP